MPFGRVATSVTPCGLTSSPQRVKSRCSKVRLRRVQPGRYSSRPLPGRIPPEAFRAARTRPSRPLAQRMPVSHRTMRQSRLPALPARIPRCPSSTARFRPHQRCRVGASIRRSVPVRGSRRTPHQRHLALTPLGRSGPGPGGRRPSHNVGLFRCSREPCVSLPWRSRARRPSRCQTASRATLHSLRSFRALGHWETLSRASARTASSNRTASHASSTRLRDSQQPRPTRKLTPQPQCVIHRHHPPDEEEKGINIYNRRSAACAAPLRFQ
jgi:hypothetical protein